MSGSKSGKNSSKNNNTNTRSARGLKNTNNEESNSERNDSDIVEESSKKTKEPESGGKSVRWRPDDNLTSVLKYSKDSPLDTPSKSRIPIPPPKQNYIDTVDERDTRNDDSSDKNDELPSSDLNKEDSSFIDYAPKYELSSNVDKYSSEDKDFEQNKNPQYDESKVEYSRSIDKTSPHFNEERDRDNEKYSERDKDRERNEKVSPKEGFYFDDEGQFDDFGNKIPDHFGTKWDRNEPEGMDQKDDDFRNKIFNKGRDQNDNNLTSDENILKNEFLDQDNKNSKVNSPKSKLDKPRSPSPQLENFEHPVNETSPKILSPRKITSPKESKEPIYFSPSSPKNSKVEKILSPKNSPTSSPKSSPVSSPKNVTNLSPKNSVKFETSRRNENQDLISKSEQYIKDNVEMDVNDNPDFGTKSNFSNSEFGTNSKRNDSDFGTKSNFSNSEWGVRSNKSPTKHLQIDHKSMPKNDLVSPPRPSRNIRSPRDITPIILNGKELDREDIPIIRDIDSKSESKEDLPTLTTDDFHKNLESNVSDEDVPPRPLKSPISREVKSSHIDEDKNTSKDSHLDPRIKSSPIGTKSHRIPVIRSRNDIEIRSAPSENRKIPELGEAKKIEKSRTINSANFDQTRNLNTPVKRNGLSTRELDPPSAEKITDKDIISSQQAIRRPIGRSPKIEDSQINRDKGKILTKEESTRVNESDDEVPYLEEKTVIRMRPPSPTDALPSENGDLPNLEPFSSNKNEEGRESYDSKPNRAKISEEGATKRLIRVKKNYNSPNPISSNGSKNVKHYENLRKDDPPQNIEEVNVKKIYRVNSAPSDTRRTSSSRTPLLEEMSKYTFQSEVEENDVSFSKFEEPLESEFPQNATNSESDSELGTNSKQNESEFETNSKRNDSDEEEENSRYKFGPVHEAQYPEIKIDPKTGRRMIRVKKSKPRPQYGHIEVPEEDSEFGDPRSKISDFGTKSKLLDSEENIPRKKIKVKKNKGKPDPRYRLYITNLSDGKPDYSSFTIMEREYARADFKAKFAALQNRLGDRICVPYPEDDDDLDILYARYYAYHRQAQILTKSKGHRDYLIVMFAIMELVGTRLLNQPMSGFLASQMVSWDQYDDLLIELGEKYTPVSASGSGVNSSWPVEIRIFFMALLSAIVFVVVNKVIGCFPENTKGQTQALVMDYFKGVLSKPTNTKENGPNGASGVPNPPSNNNTGNGLDIGTLANFAMNLLGGNNKSNNNNSGPRTIYTE